MIYNKNLLLKEKIRIIQTSPQHTGSTLLTNILFGLITPNMRVPKLKDINFLLETEILFKSHRLNINYFKKEYPDYKFFFVCSERDELKINSKYYDYENVLVINYEDLIRGSVEEIVYRVAEKFENFFPYKINLKRRKAVERVKKMEERYQEIKDLPFTFIDDFYQIHGSHKNREKIEKEKKDKNEEVNNEKKDLLKIPFFIKARNLEKRVERKVPYIIVQTMKTNLVPEDMYKAAMSFVEKNPEYDYYFYDDEGCKKFIKENYPETYLSCFNMLKAGAAKADLFRWLFLYKKGGVYVDIDAVCNKSIEALFEENLDFLTVQTGCNLLHRLNHMLIISSPNNIILEKSIENAISNILYLFIHKENKVMPQDICGPTVIGMVINELMGKNKTSSLKEIWGKTVEFKNMKVNILLNQRLSEFLKLKYENYFKDLAKIGQIRYNNTTMIGFDYLHASNIINPNNHNLDLSLMNKNYY